MHMRIRKGTSTRSGTMPCERTPIADPHMILLVFPRFAFGSVSRRMGGVRRWCAHVADHEGS